jgi:hypothetical protein
MMDTTTSALIKRSNFKRMGNLILARIDSRQTRNFLVPLLWTLVIGIELFLLLDDITLFHRPQREDLEITGERIAELHDPVGGVRWQNPKDVVWNEARGGQALYEGQSVMTVSESSARLSFDAASGASTEIEVGSKTLLQLQAKKTAPGSPLLLTLRRGGFRARTNRPLEISAGEFSVSVDPGSTFEVENVAAEKTRSGRPALRLKLQRGTAHAGTSVVSKNQILEVPLTATLVPTVRESEPSPLPAPNSTPTPTPVRVQVLPPPTLRAPIFRRHTPRAPAPKRSPGVSFLDSLIPSAEADEIPTPTSPDEWEIVLRWDAVAGAHGYRVEISRTRDFRKKIAADSTPDPHWIWLYRRGMENTKGRIFYRIATVNAQGQAGAFSAPVPFWIPANILHPVTNPAVPKPERKTARPPKSPRASARPPQWSARAFAELTSFTETSDFSQLKSVDLDGPFLHEAFALSHETSDLRFRGAFHANSFKSESGALPKTRSLSALLAGERATAWWGGHFFFGAAAVLEDRFEKAGLNSLRLTRGLSLGPSASLVGAGWFFTLRLPVSGIFGSGFLAGPYGPTAHFERDWEIAALGSGSTRTPVSISVSVEGRYHLWETPDGAKVTGWSIGLGPKIILR